MRLRIDIINMRSIVGNEDAGWSAVGLRVEELVHLLGLRQKSSLGLDAVLPGQQRGDIGGLQIDAVLAGALERLGEREGERRNGRRLLCT